MEALGLIRLTAEVGMEQSGHILTDSTAAKGTVSRSGSGRLKHVQTSQLWVQEKASRRELHYSKIRRADNLADVLANH